MLKTKIGKNDLGRIGGPYEELPNFTNRGTVVPGVEVGVIQDGGS